MVEASPTAAGKQEGKMPRTAVEAGAPPGDGCQKLVAPLAAQEAGKMPPVAVEAGAPLGLNDKKMPAPVAAQEVGKMPPKTVKAGRDDENMAAPTVVEAETHPVDACRKLAAPLATL